MNYRQIMLAAAALSFGTAAFAQAADVAPPGAPAPAVGGVAKTGQMIRDTNSLRIGSIERVDRDGSVHVILNGRFVTIPGSTISVTGGNVTTSMAKKQISKL